MEWADCYTDLQCARLKVSTCRSFIAYSISILSTKVPLNYSEPEGETIAIAVIQFPSSFSRESPDYLGPILLNPGGPGGSGVDFLRRIGHTLSELFDSRFDIVSFDPRGEHHCAIRRFLLTNVLFTGVARSARVSFFDTDVKRELWAYNALEELGGKPEGVPMAWAKATITGRLAGEHDTGILAHINTDHTARDMLEITQAYGYEKIQYWGFSYVVLLFKKFPCISEVASDTGLSSAQPLPLCFRYANLINVGLQL